MISSTGRPCAGRCRRSPAGSSVIRSMSTCSMVRRHAGAVDDVADARAAGDDGSIAPYARALLGDGGVVEVVGRGHRPGLDLLRVGVLAAGNRSSPSSRPLRARSSGGGCPSRPRAVRGYRHGSLGPTIRARRRRGSRRPGPAAALRRRLGQAEVRLEPRVDARVGGVVDRHAVRFLAGEGGQDALAGGHLA